MLILDPKLRLLKLASAAAALCLGLAVSLPASAEDVPRDAGQNATVPSLERVLAIVRDRGPDVVLSRADVATARAGYVGARLAAVGNPYLELVGERSTRRGTSLGNTSVTGTLWLPVEVSGQRGRRIAETDALVALRGASLEATRAETAAAAVSAYGAVVVSAERVRVLGELGKVAESEARSYRERFAAGDATLRDARMAELELARLETLLEETRADLANAYTRLSELTGSAWSEPPSAELRPPLPRDTLGLLRNLEAVPALREAQAAASYHERTKQRFDREGSGSLNLIVSGGRGEIGDARVGVGVGYAFPVLRRFQGEQARAEAERSRALVEKGVRRRTAEARVRGLGAELAQIGVAREKLVGTAEPAAKAAVDAAVDMQRAGKGDLLTVLTSRRDLGLLQLRRVDLAAREWNVLADLTAIFGRLP